MTNTEIKIQFGFHPNAEDVAAAISFQLECYEDLVQHSADAIYIAALRSDMGKVAAAKQVLNNAPSLDFAREFHTGVRLGGFGVVIGTIRMYAEPMFTK